VSVTSEAARLKHPSRAVDWRRFANRHGWTLGVYVLLVATALYWQTAAANFSSFDVQSLVIDAMPLAFAAMAQAIVVISGGIDLSIGSLMSVVNVLAARYMVSASFREALLLSVAIVAGTALAGAFTGLLITVTRVADIVVTLALLFFWQGVALTILGSPGGGAPLHFVRLGTGYTGTPWLPTGLVTILAAFALVWLPLRRAKPGLAVYAIGSDRTAAYLGGISVAKTRIGAYLLAGVFTGLGGLALTAASGQGDPNAGAFYLLNGVAAVVLGGVSLAGGKGGLIGPIAAAFILTLIKTILVLKGVDPNYVQVVQGTIIIVVVVLGALVLVRRRGA
jgi:ribose transport system permease protein